MKQIKNKIFIQNPYQYKRIPSDRYLRQWVNLALNKQKKALEITIRIVNEKESAELNSTYRHKAGSTNVLSFHFEAPKKIDISYLGDLVICMPVLAREAKQQHKLLLAHWAHIVMHGVLHLLGYDHVKTREAVVMEKIEIKLLRQLGYPNPYE